MLRHNVLWLTVALLLAVAGTAVAAELEVQEARLRLLPGDLPAAGYFRLANTGEQTVVLTGAHTPAYARAQMHKSTINEGQAQMAPIARLTIDAGKQITFAPGGYHFMFMQRRHPLAIGDTLNVTFEFEDGQTLPVEFRVISPASL